MGGEILGARSLSIAQEKPPYLVSGFCLVPCVFTYSSGQWIGIGLSLRKNIKSRKNKEIDDFETGFRKIKKNPYRKSGFKVLGVDFLGGENP